MRTVIRIVIALALIEGCAYGASLHLAMASGRPANWELAAALFIPTFAYIVALRTMHREGVTWRIVGPIEAASFVAGMLLLAVALIGPVDAIADELFSAHMIQHLLLLLVAPPLLVLGRPAVVFIWAFPRRGRRALGRGWTALRLVKLAQWLMQPVFVSALFTGLFIFWHLPKPYGWALANERIHTVEHLCFFVSGLMFWTIVIEPHGRRRLSYPATLAHISVAAMISSFPGALVALARQPLYPISAARAAEWGLTPLQDQQFAGAIMWIPGGMVFVVAGAWLFFKWFAELNRRDSGRRATAPLLLAAVLPLTLFCSVSRAQAEPLSTEGNPQRGRELIRHYGCGSCHVIPGISGADSDVGPPLTSMGRRIYVAGMLRNTPDNLTYWIEHPQEVVPGNAMPDMGITRRQAQDIAAYLLTLR